jgi:hypothetical protein
VIASPSRRKLGGGMAEALQLAAWWLLIGLLVGMPVGWWLRRRS